MIFILVPPVFLASAHFVVRAQYQERIYAMRSILATKNVIRPVYRGRPATPSESVSEDGVSLKAFVDSVIFCLAISCCEVQIVSREFSKFAHIVFTCVLATIDIL